MNIVFLTSSMSRSGGSRQAYYLARGLAAHGHDLTFFTPQGAELPGLDGDAGQGSGIRWLELPAAKGKWRRAVREVLAAHWDRGEPCVLQAFHNRAVKKASLWGLVWRCKPLVVLGYRGVVFRPRNPLPYWSPGVDAFVVNSEACAKVLRRVGVSGSRIRVVYNGVPPERLVPGRSVDEVRGELGLEGPGRQVVIGSLTDNKPNKGADRLLQAFALARKDPSFAARSVLVLVGVKPERWRERCAELGATEGVRLVDRVECVADYLQVFDMLAASSLAESMPNALLEGMGMGLPLVAAAAGGVAEIVRGNGLLVDPDDVPGLAQALAEASQDASRRAAWAEESRERFKLFSLARKVARTEAIYAETLKARGLDPGDGVPSHGGEAGERP